MNLTIGFIAFFVSIIIPGILFRRFFFYGEFSKQFNTKDPVLHSMFLSIVPGICLQVLGFTFYYLVLGFNGSFLDIFTILRDVTSDGVNETTATTQDFINNHLTTFFFYSISVFSFSALSGITVSRLIRWQKLDKKYKLFRFQNQWYYIFSGEVLNMKKFKEAYKISFNRDENFNRDVSTTYADILVSISEDYRELYTGYVVDYDLNSEDISKLDKIYLLDAYRYKKKEVDNSDEIVDGNNQNELEKRSSRVQKKIPGDVFILKAENIININLTFIPSPEKKVQKALKQQQLYRWIRLIYLFVILSIISFHFFYKTIGLEGTFFEEYVNNSGFFGKFFSILFVNQLLNFASPSEDKEEKLSYNKEDIGARILALFVWGILAYIFAFRYLL